MSINTVAVVVVIVAVQLIMFFFSYCSSIKKNLGLVYIYVQLMVCLRPVAYRVYYSVYIAGICGTCLKVMLNYTVESHKYLSESRNSF